MSEAVRPGGHPTDAIAATIGPASGWLGASAGRVPAGDLGWWACPGPDASDVLDRWYVQLAAAMADACGSVPPVVPFVRTLEYALAVPAVVSAVAFAEHRRLPRVDSDSLAFRLDHEYPYPVEVRLLRRDFWCLPDDPDAEHPDARVVPDKAALGAQLRLALDGHARWLSTYTRPGIRLARRQRLGLLTDVVDEVLLSVGRARMDVASAREDADRVFGVPGADVTPFVVGSSIYAFSDPLGRRQWSRTRATCCLSYRLPGGHAVTCFTCPRTTGEARLEASREWSANGP